MILYGEETFGYLLSPSRNVIHILNSIKKKNIMNEFLILYKKNICKIIHKLDLQDEPNVLSR